jgi:hypothetical protein
MKENAKPVASSQPPQTMIAARTPSVSGARRRMIMATVASSRAAGISQVIMPPETVSNSRLIEASPPNPPPPPVPPMPAPSPRIRARPL